MQNVCWGYGRQNMCLGLDRKDEDYLVEKEPSFTERDNWRYNISNIFLFKSNQWLLYRKMNVLFAKDHFKTVRNTKQIILTLLKERGYGTIISLFIISIILEIFEFKIFRSRDPWTSAGSLVSCSTTWWYTLSWFFSRIFCPAKMFLNS